MTGFTIRPAVSDDAEGVARVHVQAWREAYPGMIPQAVLDRRDTEVSVERWRSMLGGGEFSAHVAVDASGRVVGWATGGAARGDDPPFGLELHGLYILREVYGRGVGAQLLEAVVGRAEGTFLWVLEANARARAFYERQGFRPDGVTQDLDFDGVAVTEIRMARLPGGESVTDQRD